MKILKEIQQNVNIFVKLHASHILSTEYCVFYSAFTFAHVVPSVLPFSSIMCDWILQRTSHTRDEEKMMKQTNNFFFF